jgi:hypothetical protein
MYVKGLHQIHVESEALYCSNTDIFLYNSVFNTVCNYDTFIYFKRVETVITIASCVKMAMCPVVWTQEHMSRQFYFTWLDVDNRS